MAENDGFYSVIFRFHISPKGRYAIYHTKIANENELNEGNMKIGVRQEREKENEFAIGVPLHTFRGRACERVR